MSASQNLCLLPLPSFVDVQNPRSGSELKSGTLAPLLCLETVVIAVSYRIQGGVENGGTRHRLRR